MATKDGLVSVLLLRFLALGALVASFVLLATDKVTFSDGTKATFKDVITYRYVVVAACIGAAYSKIQIPFLIYHASKEKRLTGNECLPEFDFIGNKMIAFLLATAAGAGLAVTYEFKKVLNDFSLGLKSASVAGIDETASNTNKFLDKAFIAVGLLFLGFLSMAILSVFSSMHTSSNGRGFFKGPKNLKV